MLHLKLKNLRQEKKKTQKELGDYLQITERAYQRYEYGTREPDLKTLVQLADYFNTTTDYLLGRTDKP